MAKSAKKLFYMNIFNVFVTNGTVSGVIQFIQKHFIPLLPSVQKM
jgi:hypothetical protein